MRPQSASFFMKSLLLTALVCLGPLLSGCEKTLVNNELRNFCTTSSTSFDNNCSLHAFFAGPDMEATRVVFIDSLTGQAVTIALTSRSDFYDVQKARVPRYFKKRNYTDYYSQQFMVRASGFPGQEGEFNWFGSAKDNSVEANWGLQTEKQLVTLLSYPTDTLPYRLSREKVQIFLTRDFNRTAPHVLEARFVGGLGLIKLRVGPYPGGEKIYLRKDLF